MARVPLKAQLWAFLNWTEGLKVKKSCFDLRIGPLLVHIRFHPASRELLCRKGSVFLQPDWFMAEVYFDYFDINITSSVVNQAPLSPWPIPHSEGDSWIDVDLFSPLSAPLLLYFPSFPCSFQNFLKVEWEAEHLPIRTPTVEPVPSSGWVPFLF